jgi:peptidoglycan/LPS O-acetylase OafA/YrhL
VLNGVRVLTMMWVVMGNTFINSIIGAVNILTIDFVIQRPFILIIEAALLTVDIFFFVGGFFMAYQFAKDLTPSLKKYPLRILGRLLRILPSYMLTILIWYSMFIHWGDGPRWIPNE